MQSPVAVIGSGSWATALVKLLSNNLQEVRWFMRNTDDCQYVKQNLHNPRYLSSVQFNENKLKLFSDVGACITNADIVVLAVPSAFCHDTIKDLPKELLADKIDRKSTRLNSSHAKISY